MDFVETLFDTSDFPARWRCGHWTSVHGWWHILSDLGIWGAYFAIPLVLIFFTWRRKDLPFRNLFWLFGGFILFCGTTHLLEAVIFWWPVYRFAALIKCCTAIISWTTVLVLIRIIPSALTLRSPKLLEQEVTARKKAEAELRQINVELELRVLERTDELSEAHQRKDEFLATLAHELRNPMASLRNGLELLKLAHADPHVMQTARDAMERQMQQLVTLVDDLLDVSRITHQKLHLRKTTIDIQTLVQHAIELVRPVMDQANQHLIVSLPPTKLYVNVDRHRIIQVFSNLLSNAAKYTPADGKIWISVEQCHEQLKVTVGDNGIGIPADRLESIFEMFSQVEGSLEQGATGLGIGLTLVRQLVHMHEGEVYARSEGKDQGSEFIVSLPIVLPQSIASNASPHPLIAPETGNPIEAVSTVPLRVLVVDDNQDAAATLQTILKLLGHEVQCAFDGLEALHTGDRFHPQVVFMDLGMPRLNGYETAKEIRIRPWGASVLLVALTGWGQDSDKQKSRDCGFDEHLTKPADPLALQQLLSRYARQSVDFFVSNKSIGPPAGAGSYDRLN